MSVTAPKSGSAITACVLGILGFLSCGITALPAIICGHVARSRIRLAGGAMSGDGLALAGLIMGYVSLMLGLAFFGLGALGGIRAAQERAQLNRTVVTHVAIMAGLELYKEKFGQYPIPAKSGIRVNMDGWDRDVSAALMLYQALTGDGTDMIRVDDSIRRPSDGKIDDEEAKNQISKAPLSKSVILKTTAGYIVVDGWGRPMQYTIGGPESVNPTYDLWSFGAARLPRGTDRATKANAEMTARWIKNW